MPVAAGARQTRHLDAEHQPDIAKADLGDKPLKAQSALDAGARAAEIVVDDDDPLSYPANCAARSASAYWSFVDS